MKKEIQNLKNIFQSSRHFSEKDLQDYVNNDLNQEKRFDLENAMLDDPFLEDAVEGFSENNFDFSKKQPYQNFDSFLNKMESEGSAKIIQMPLRKRMGRVIAVAASLALLLVIGNNLYNNMSSLSNEELFAQSFETYQSDLPSFRGGIDDQITVLELFERGMEEYDNGNFQASLPFLEDFLSADAENHFGLFYAGMANLESGNFDKAIELLNQAAAQNENYSKKAKWYLILATLKSGDREAAEKLLNEYVESGTDFMSERAQKLQTQI